MNHLKIGMIGLMLMFFCLGLQAQEEHSQSTSDRFEELEVEGRLLLFIEELDALSARILRSDEGQLRKADKKVLAIDNKWNLYSQVHQAMIAADEQLMEIVVRYQENKQMVTDSIQAQLHKLESFDAFQKAEHAMDEQQKIYTEWYETSQEYSLLKQQASLLEKLKVKEQLVFAEITTQYEASKAISQEFPVLHPRMKKMEEEYIELKGLSEKIQAAEYKPFLDRIKDYLYSFAAVAILLMFINMIQSKVQAYKQMRKSAEEYKKMLQRNDNEYPSI